LAFCYLIGPLIFALLLSRRLWLVMILAVMAATLFYFSMRMDMPQVVRAVEAVGQHQGFVVQQSYGRA